MLSLSYSEPDLDSQSASIPLSKVFAVESVGRAGSCLPFDLLFSALCFSIL
jgi:hypothetical protein